MDAGCCRGSDLPENIAVRFIGIDRESGGQDQLKPVAVLASQLVEKEMLDFSLIVALSAG